MSFFSRHVYTGKQVLLGLSSYVPVLRRRFQRGTGGSTSARYCYSVWLRHLVVAARNGLIRLPRRVAELGPGDSIGIGLSALLSGAENYFALDVVEYANPERNLRVFNELVGLFRAQAAIPDEAEFPLLKPALTDHSFPHDMISPAVLERSLNEDRLEKFRAAIVDPKQAGSPIQYIVPWNDIQAIPPESVDMILSQAAFEHVDDLELAYRAMYRWLSPGGFISNQIDFKCHWQAEEWNGHWTYPDRIWKWIQGKQPYLLNREPHSTHLRLLKQNGFILVDDKRVRMESRITRKHVALRFRDMSPDDLTISGALLQARK